jgi:tetratricopeptide (TPR) repeat protein
MHKSLFIMMLAASTLLFAGCGEAPPEPNSNVAEVNADAPVPEYTDANTALADGTKFLDEDEVDKAISALNQAVRLNPDLAEAYFKLGVAYALVETRDALNLEATPDPEPVNTGGKKKPEPKKANSQIAFEKAVDAYKKVIDANPDDHQAHFNLGLSYLKLNEDEDAAKALKKAVELNPEDSLYQTELGSVLIRLAQYREAIAPLKKALELDPDNIEAEELLSDAEAGRKRIDYRSTPKPTPGGSSTDSSESNTSSPTQKPSPVPQRSPTPRRTPASNRP